MWRRRRSLALISAVLAAAVASTAATARDDDRDECNLDAMLVFDASGSMAGTDWIGQVSRISHVRNALQKVLPEITRVRRFGLITYGPGPYNKCDNIELQLRPGWHTPRQIMSRVETLVPAGRTPLTAAVEEAAKILRYREKPAVVVLLTDGEETCGGKPCELGRALKEQGADTTVHVISYLSRETATGAGLLGSRCLARETGGLQVTAETTDELIDAFRRTLACPLVTKMKGGMRRVSVDGPKDPPSPMKKEQSHVCGSNRPTG